MAFLDLDWGRRHWKRLWNWATQICVSRLSGTRCQRRCKLSFLHMGSQTSTNSLPSLEMRRTWYKCSEMISMLMLRLPWAIVQKLQQWFALGKKSVQRQRDRQKLKQKWIQGNGPNLFLQETMYSSAMPINRRWGIWRQSYACKGVSGEETTGAGKWRVQSRDLVRSSEQGRSRPRRFGADLWCQRISQCEERFFHSSFTHGARATEEAVERHAKLHHDAGFETCQ